MRQSLCDHVMVLPEAAGIVFSGGFAGGEGEKRAFFVAGAEKRESAT